MVPSRKASFTPPVDFLPAEGIRLAQHLEVLQLPSLNHPGLQEKAQGIELSVKLPSRQGRRLVQAPTLRSIKGR